MSLSAAWVAAEWGAGAAGAAAAAAIAVVEAGAGRESAEPADNRRGWMPRCSRLNHIQSS